MKTMKLLLASGVVLACLSVQAQVSFTVTAPASIAGAYDFTSNGDGTDWGLPNLLDPADAVLDTLMLVDDGTPGINAQGIPMANEGCGPLVNDLTGKIAVVYRYDGASTNVCWYGTKVLNAQNAGAVGVIMINREDGLIDVPGTTDGPLTTIPFAFISKSDGAALRARMDAGEDVVAFIGNKLGLYPNDAGIVKKSTLIPSISAAPVQLAQNASEFGFDLGSTIYNYGSNNLNNVQLTATVTGPAGTWTQTAGPYTINAGDSLDVLSGGTNPIPAYSQASYPAGWYNLTYSLDIGAADDALYDNELSFDFVMTDSLLSYARLDPATNLPRNTYETRSNGTSFASCIAFESPNASRLAVKGLYFASYVLWSSTLPLTGEELELSIYSWDDVFTDLNDPAFAMDNLTLLTYGFYTYQDDLQGETVYGAFEFPVQLEDNQRYLGCVQTGNEEIWMGFDNGVNYTRNIGHYLQAQNPISTDGTYYALGFGEKLTSSVSMSVFDAADLSVKEDELEGLIYPNPVQDQLTLSLAKNVSGTIEIYDLSGRMLSQSTIENEQVIELNTEELNAGSYRLVVSSEAGNSSFQFVKQ